MIKLILSDLHIGSGYDAGQLNPFEEFHYDSQLADLLNHYSTGPHEGRSVELILAGDIFDLVKVAVNHEITDEITEEISVQKLARCLNGHPVILGALRSFLAKPHHSLTYMMGNHDMDLAFPRVQELFRSLVGGPDFGDRIRFVVHHPYYQVAGGVRIYHGNQFEALNQVNLRKLFITEGYRDPILNLPWGSVFLIKVLLQFKEKRPYLTMIQPFGRYLRLALFTDTRFALPLTAKGFYYFVKTRFVETRKSTHNIRNTLRILKEEAVFSQDLAEVAGEIFKNAPGLTTVFMGHNHRAQVRRYPGDRMYINTGTWTRQINLTLTDLGIHERLTYGYVDYPDSEARPRVGLFRWFGHQEVSKEIKY